jgi:beta-N-acetylhexosaminidase
MSNPARMASFGLRGIAALGWLLHTLWAQKTLPGFFLERSRWVDSILAHLSLEQKIGQLLMVPAYSTPTQQNRAQIERWIREYHIGGVIFMQGSPSRQVSLTNYYQRQSAIPLLVAMDAEWGPSMRLDSLPRYPYALTLGALREDSLVYRVAQAIARQCKRLGVHINFAPVCDVNNNPQNPVIGFRAFGSDRHRVTQLALLYMQALQREGIVAVAKHFPGHGDTEVDSHYDLPVIRHSRARLDSIELYPFRHLIREGVMGIMIAHLLVPALDTVTATVSPVIIDSLLRKELGFRGIVFSDALNMKAVSLYYAPGELEVAALRAGADVLLYVEQVPVVFRAIQEAVLAGRLTETQIDEKVRRILLLKASLGLTTTPQVPETGLMADLWAEPLLEPLRQAYIQAVTLVQNRQALLPLGSLKDYRPLYVQIGYERPAPFYRYLSQYMAIDYVVIPSVEALPADSLLRRLSEYNLFIVGLFNLSQNPRRSFGLRPKVLDFLCELRESDRKVITCIFGNPYTLSFFGEEEAIILGYQEDTLAQWQAVNVIMGTGPPTGVLPVEPPLRYPRYVAYDKALYRPVVPYRSPYSFQRLDSLLSSVVSERITPGFAITVIYRDTVVYNKGWGGYSYTDRRRPSPTHTLYDVASLTKVFVTTLMAMDLYERGELRLQEPLSKRVPAWASTPAGRLTPYQLLTHTAGYPPTLPLLQAVRSDSAAFSDSLTETHTLPLSRRCYLHRHLPSTLWKKILSHPPSKPTSQPVYSDIGFVILGRYLEAIAGESMISYVSNRFYRPMGLYRLHFYPALNCLDTLCVPTEVDTLWRKDTLCGYVHDPTAALLGGFAGNAGLFASSQDLAYLMWMLVKGGEYGGNCYFSASTVRTFTKEAGNLGRGLGWDKPSKEKTSTAPPPLSTLAFGHLGFTGTAAWADPTHNLIVIILSNRIHPTATDPRYNQLLIRRKIMETILGELRLSS